ncbi:MAG: hypothetical protein NT062_01845, partial [Proteobacteria bacterium]|nr:hypothetical protein [Pseudomonadota bacterium]
MAGGPYNPMGGHAPQQQPMGGPPMMGAPMGPMPTAQVTRPQIKRGVSRVVPVVMSAGLAMGTFCGLLFGLGTGVVGASPSKLGGLAKSTEAETKPDVAKPDVAKPTEPVKTEAAKPEPAKTEPAKPETAATGSGSATTVAAGSGSAVKTEPPAIKSAKLTFSVKPDGAKTITVDGKDVKDGAIEVALDGGAKKSVKIVIKAAGFQDYEKTYEVGGDQRFEAELTKAAKAVATTTPTVATATKPTTAVTKPATKPATKPVTKPTTTTKPPTNS